MSTYSRVKKKKFSANLIKNFRWSFLSILKSQSTPDICQALPGVIIFLLISWLVKPHLLRGTWGGHWEFLLFFFLSPSAAAEQSLELPNESKFHVKINSTYFVTSVAIWMVLNEVSVLTKRDITSLKKTIPALPPKPLLFMQVLYFPPCWKLKQVLQSSPMIIPQPTLPPLPRFICYIKGKNYIHR